MIKTATDAAMYLLSDIQNVQQKEDQLRDVVERMLHKHGFQDAEIEKALNIVFRGTNTVN